MFYMCLIDFHKQKTMNSAIFFKFDEIISDAVSPKVVCNIMTDLSFYRNHALPFIFVVVFDYFEFLCRTAVKQLAAKSVLN